MTQSRSVDLTNCDREPIHIPGSIQPYGCLLALDATTRTVLRHSDNVPAIMGLDLEINGQTFDSIVGEEPAHALRNALATATGSRAAQLFALVINGRSFDVAIHRGLSGVIVELEPSGNASQPLQLARMMLSRLGETSVAKTLNANAVRVIRAVLGYDRVMVYEFGQDGSGKVVAEAKRKDLESFLGQYFPASDIPRQARRLYLANTIRVISDASGERIPLVPVLDVSGEPLDLSGAFLRSVSPIHCEYLRNMGVAASMSISVIIKGELTGLIACHHYSPLKLPMAQRVAAEMFGEFLSLRLELAGQQAGYNEVNRARATLDDIVQQASYHGSLSDLLSDSLRDIVGLIPCDGVGLWLDDKWAAHGLVPPDAALPGLLNFVRDMSGGAVWATHALSQHMPSAESYAAAVSGVLAIPLSQRPRDYLLMFRKEAVETLEWAGNPDKTYEQGPLGDRLTPRKSFAVWKQTVENQCHPWTAIDRSIAETTHNALVSVVLRYNELLADERSKFDVRQRMLNEELNHRVKNILAIIKSLVGYPVREGQVLEDYVASLKGRIQALSFAHDQIVRGDGGGELYDLLDAELLPYRAQSTGIRLNGGSLWLDSRAFSVMALVLHELSTNAAKYGALSVPAGQLDVDWTVDRDGQCRLTWRESGGPLVIPPRRRGFGSVLVDRSVPYELDGSSSVSYEPAGLVAEFVIPGRHFSTVRGRRAANGSHPDRAPAGLGQPLAVTRLLMVEDQMLIAMDAEAMLADIGVTDVVVCRSCAEGLNALRSFEPDCAILDINLGSETSVAVALELRSRDIPFVFATGYGDLAVIPDDFEGVEVVRKPYDTESLRLALQSILAKQLVCGSHTAGIAASGT